MQYLEVTFTVSPVSETANDIIAALAAELGFESFVESEQGTIGYVPINLYDEQALNEALSDFPMPDTQVTFTTCEMEDKNWNEEWEKHFFEPIVVDSRCVIHSTFHKDYPKADFDIIINPQMAFGTGHHQTTRLIISYLLDIELSGKTVLDMGCGTSILAILASMRGAKALTAIDIDEWCVNNSIDNLALNGINNIKVFQGDASSLASEGPFDVVIANINRNILLADMQYYVARMNQGGEIYFSGFYESDLPMIQAEAERLGLRYISHRVEKEWTAAQFAL
ncbi:MAG: 50S ribosomal protein L11 methyltransferase [Bacteroidaceae bacterium]|nr:50S ribosomal protein L11 methyltransferase [Bacteroidaceae bacterium]